VDRWLKKMGYRLVLRKFTYPAAVMAGGKLDFTSWWDNKGVAPCYHPFRLALRLKRGGRRVVLPTTADIRTWLPGDNLCDGDAVVPVDISPGQYDLAIGILDRRCNQPRVKLAIAGVDAEGWYRMGTIRVQE
jgi:hypothetical protein